MLLPNLQWRQKLSWRRKRVVDQFLKNSRERNIQLKGRTTVIERNSIGQTHPSDEKREEEVVVDPKIGNNSFMAQKNSQGAWGGNVYHELKNTRGKSLGVKKLNEER